MVQKAITFFESFCSSFEIKKGLDLKSTYSHKYYHTYRVLKWMKLIIKKQNLTKQEQEYAEVVAIFHDLGRFIQLTKYHKYNDQITKFDHGKESINILKQHH